MDDEHRLVLESCQDTAVDKTLKWLGESVAQIRWRSGGKHRAPVKDGLIDAVLRHWARSPFPGRGAVVRRSGRVQVLCGPGGAADSGIRGPESGKRGWSGGAGTGRQQTRLHDGQ
ncbi:hypothetical protein [Streptomyces sp. NPDC059816]|uniref:hypothetical protein n=1 Tax=Streptomyces sp. NPDC059816 TaxID=3346960 RepID=UPI003649E85F